LQHIGVKPSLFPLISIICIKNIFYFGFTDRKFSSHFHGMLHCNAI